MSIYLLLFGILAYEAYADSNYIPDYPNVTFCVFPDTHPVFKKGHQSYTYLQRQMGLNRRCTHISGSLTIEDLERLDNGSDPDVSFLESIVEISGVLKIMSNSIRRIPLGNLKVIRGISEFEKQYSIQISHNAQNDTHFLEEVDLHSLRAIMSKSVRINHNYGFPYLIHKVDWNQIILNPLTQRLVLQSLINKTIDDDYKCHASCEYWNKSTGIEDQSCFGPEKRDCQQRAKCDSTKDHKWCQFMKGQEVLCDRECIGGCYGILPSNCVACGTVYKMNQCVSSCSVSGSTLFGNYDSNVYRHKLIYTTAGFCTSQCPDSLLEQDKICLYECDFENYYKNGNRCFECPQQKCFTQMGDQLTCDLKKLDTNYPKKMKKYSINLSTLLKLKNCSIILGQLNINDKSFSTGITIEMLYSHLANVREVIGEVTIQLFNNSIKNLTFLSNLEEVRGSTSLHSLRTALNIFVSSLEFLGLKKLKKVYGVVNFNHTSNLCYVDKIPWSEITRDLTSESKCDKKCDPICTRGCWGPGNTFCYKCEFLEAGEHCVANCNDIPGFYTNITFLSNGLVNEVNCRKCHPLCKYNCSGPLLSNCSQCRFVKENGNCVQSCSVDHYPLTSSDNGTFCLPCHKVCDRGEVLKLHNITAVCSGPSDQIGPGGCSLCHRTIGIDNRTRCHSGLCPKGFFESKEPHRHWNFQQISCKPCNELCSECSSVSTSRHSCKKCTGFWSKDNCESRCPDIVYNVEVLSGDKCPTCHAECRNGCHGENDSSKCVNCANKKIFQSLDMKNFSCIPVCPAMKNYTELMDGDPVCVSYVETMYYKHARKHTVILFVCLAIFLIVIIIFILVFKYNFGRMKVKAELKALYSNSNEPTMKEALGGRPPNMKKLHMIPISDLVFDSTSKPLGAGAYGKVFRGSWKTLGRDGKICPLDVVVKVIYDSSKSSTNEFLEEMQIMASVSHRYCLPLIGVCLSLEKPCLVSAFAEFGSLEKHLRLNSSTISSSSLLVWAEQIADGMAYLNLRGIIHRDLATRNILISHKNIVQITDFGLARLVDDTDDGIVVRSGRVPVRWLALETLESATYSTATDVWAYGVTLWEMFTFGRRPYHGLENSDIKPYLQAGNRLYQPDVCSLEVYMVMVKCWLEDPPMRPSFTELMTTFEKFSHQPKGYLSLPTERDQQHPLMEESKKEFIYLNTLYENSDSRPTNEGVINNEEGEYQIKAESFIEKENDYIIHLPRRKKSKRSVSFNRQNIFQKLKLTRFISTSSQDEKCLQYNPSSGECNKEVSLTSQYSELTSKKTSPEYVRVRLTTEENVNHTSAEICGDISEDTEYDDGYMEPTSKFAR